MTHASAPTVDGIDVLASLGNLTTELAARIGGILSLPTEERREEAARAAARRRQDLELYADAYAERFHRTSHRPNVRKLLVADELYTTLSLLAVA